MTTFHAKLISNKRELPNLGKGRVDRWIRSLPLGIDLAQPFTGEDMIVVYKWFSKFLLEREIDWNMLPLRFHIHYPINLGTILHTFLMLWKMLM
jgi:hypothetical protein